MYSKEFFNNFSQHSPKIIARFLETRREKENQALFKRIYSKDLSIFFSQHSLKIIARFLETRREKQNQAFV